MQVHQSRQSLVEWNSSGHTLTHPHTSEAVITPLLMCLDCGRELEETHTGTGSTCKPHTSFVQSVRFGTDEAGGGRTGML